MNTNHSFSEKFRGLIERSQFLSQPKSLKIRPLFFGTLGLLLMAATQATGQVSSAKVPLKNAIALDGPNAIFDGDRDRILFTINRWLYGCG